MFLEEKDISLSEWSDALYANLFENNFGLILLGKTRKELDVIGLENNLGDHKSFYNCLFNTISDEGFGIEIPADREGEICNFSVNLFDNWEAEINQNPLNNLSPDLNTLSQKKYPPYLSVLVFLASAEFEQADNKHTYYPKVERIITEFGFPKKLFSENKYRNVLCNKYRLWEKFDEWCHNNGSRIQKYTGTYQRYVQRARVHSLIDFGNRKNIYNLLKNDFSFTVPPSIRQIKDRIIRYPDVNKKLCIENCNDNDKLISQSVYSLILNDLRIGFVRKSNEIINLKPVYFLNQKYGEFKLVKRLDVSKVDINNFPLLYDESDIKLDKSYNNLLSSKLDNIPDFNIDIDFIINKNYRITRNAKDYLIFRHGRRNREYIETNKIIKDQDYYVLCSNKSFNTFSTWKDNLPDNEKDYVVRKKYINEGELFLVKPEVISTFTSNLVKEEMPFETIDDIKVIGGIKIENNIYANIHPPSFEIEGVVKKENIHLYLNNIQYSFDYDYKIIDNLTYIIFNGELPFGVIKIYCLLEGKKKDDLIEKEECFSVRDETHILFEKNSPNWLSKYSVESDCITDNQDDDIEIEGELCLDITTEHLVDLQKKFTDEHSKHLLENIKKWNHVSINRKVIQYLQVFDYLYNYDANYRRNISSSIDEFVDRNYIKQYYPYLLYRELDLYLNGGKENDNIILNLINEFVSEYLEEDFPSKNDERLLFNYFNNLVKCYIYSYNGEGNVLANFRIIEGLFEFRNLQINNWLGDLEEDSKMAKLHDNQEQLKILHDFKRLKDKDRLFKFNDWLSTAEVENNSNFLNEVKILESLSIYFSNNTISNTRRHLRERVFQSISRNIPEFNSDYTGYIINGLIALGHLFRSDNNISITPPTFIKMRNLDNDVVYYYCGFRTSIFLNKLELLCENKDIEIIKKQHQVKYKEQYPLSIYIKTETIQDIVGILKVEFPDLYIKCVENGINQDCINFLVPLNNLEVGIISNAILLKDRQEWDMIKGEWKLLTDSIDYKIIRYKLYGQYNFFISNNYELRKIKSPFLYQIELLFKEGEHCVLYRKKDSSLLFDKRIDLPLELRRILVMCNGVLEYEEEAVNIIPLDKDISINPQNTFMKFQNIDQKIIDRMMEVIEDRNYNIINIK